MLLHTLFSVATEQIMLRVDVPLTQLAVTLIMADWSKHALISLYLLKPNYYILKSS